MKPLKLIKRAVSPLITTVILIAICLVAGLLVYNVFFSTTGIITSKGQVTVEAVDLVVQTDGHATFTITLKNSGNKPVTDLTVNLAGTDYPVALPSDGFQPGQSTSYVKSDPTPPAGGFIVGNSYSVPIKASFDDGGSFSKTETVKCLGSGGDGEGGGVETETFTPIYDGYCFGKYPSYDGCWELDLAYRVYDHEQWLTIGQFVWTSGEYDIWRSFLAFNTSSLSGKTIVSAILRLHCDTDQSTRHDFDVVIQNGQPTYPHIPLVKGDYLQSYYEGNGGSTSTSTFTAHEWFEIELNADGISWINKTGITKFCLRSSRDIAKLSPTYPLPSQEQIYISSSEDVEKCFPELIINSTP